jgi:hypothetical protein
LARKKVKSCNQASLQNVSFLFGWQEEIKSEKGGQATGSYLECSDQEAEIRRIVVQSQPGQKVREILTQKTLHKNRAGGVVQGEDPEFKPQYQKNFFLLVFKVF